MALVGAILLALYVVPSPWDIVVLIGGIVLEIGETIFWWKLSHRRKPKVGVETLVGTSATVITSCRPRGQVRVAGEIWTATCADGADPGEVVRVVAVDGLALVVTPG
jgi:membrane protein implicated in regulation of membrane protease activity